MKLDLQSTRVIHKINFSYWKKNHSWIIASLSLLILQVIMGIILVIPCTVGLLILTNNHMSALGRIISISLFAVIFLLVLLLMGVFMKVALTRASLDYIKKERYQMENFFIGFRMYGRSLQASIIIITLILISSIPTFFSIALGIFWSETWLILIGVIFAAAPCYVYILYSQVFYMIQEDTSGLGMVTLLRGSKELMEGYKLRYALTIFPLILLLIIPSYALSGYLWYYTTSIDTILVLQYVIGVVSLIIWSYILSIKGYFYLGLITKEVPQDLKKEEIINSEEFSTYEK